MTMTAKRVSITLPALYKKQKAAIFSPARYSWIEGSTKSGKTAGCLTWILAKALKGRAGDNFWWVAPVAAQAKIAFDRLRGRDFLRNLDRSLYTVNLSERSVTLRDAGKIWFKSGDNPDSLYGEDVYGAVIDEASRCKAESYDAVRSTLTFTGGQIRLIGNVRGRGNWFFKGCRAAQGGHDPAHAYHRITALDAVEAGVFPEEELEDARQAFEAQGRGHVFAELYLCEPSDDGGNPFGLANLTACTDVSQPAVDTVCSSRPPLVWGWDLAKSADWTVGIALDDQGHVCGLHRWQGKSWQETIQRILSLTGTTHALVDSSGVGDPVVESLQSARPGVFEGFKFSSQSKQKLMESLALAIGTKALRFGQGTLHAELTAFEYEHRRTHTVYTAPAGLHDDCVMALALAWHHHKRARKLQNLPPPSLLTGGSHKYPFSRGW